VLRLLLGALIGLAVGLGVGYGLWDAKVLNSGLDIKGRVEHLVAKQPVGSVQDVTCERRRINHRTWDCTATMEGSTCPKGYVAYVHTPDDIDVREARQSVDVRAALALSDC
jgi:hypothetical protein